MTERRDFTIEDVDPAEVPTDVPEPFRADDDGNPDH